MVHHRFLRPWSGLLPDSYPEDESMGIPSSHGCIKMRNEDVSELFDMVPVGTPVNIIEGS